jgi:hypothetical protein
MAHAHLAASSGEIALSLLQAMATRRLIVRKVSEERTVPPKRRRISAPIPFDELSAPAKRALTAAGFRTLAQLARVPERRIAELHGIGPSALRTLRRRLAAHDPAFAR